ncbi:hypothetical protein [Photobacterium phosphoreum]|nr:hypothetical protein [Photobacterium phosphoreum]
MKDVLLTELDAQGKESRQKIIDMVYKKHGITPFELAVLRSKQSKQ